MCACSVPLSKLDLSGQPRDIYVQEFRGLGRGRGFRVKLRTSVLGDQKLPAQLLARARAIVDLLDRTSGRQSEEEYLAAELEEALATVKSLRSRVLELEETVWVKDEVIRASKAAVKTAAAREEESQLAAVELEEERRELAERACALLRSLRPLLGEVEYLALDEGELVGLSGEVEEAMDSLEEALTEIAD